MNKNKMRSHPKPLTSHLNIFVIFSILISTLNGNMVLAQPLCYLIDANGNRINLSGICGKSPQATVIPQKTPPTPEKPSPDAKSGNDKPTQENQANPENPQGNNPNSQNNTGESGNTLNTGEKEEIDTSNFPPAQRKIPLLQNQKKEQITDNQ